MYRIVYFVIAAVIGMTFYSCSDYEGSEPDSIQPVVYLYDTTDSTSNKKTKIKWYGNDIDGVKLKYFYTVTTDTFLTPVNVFEKLPLDINDPVKWISTYETYAMISLPFSKMNADTVFYDIRNYGEVITISGDTIPLNFKAVYSKFFVLGIDESGGMTAVRSKIFKRTNIKPLHPMVYSKKLGVNGYAKYWMTVGPDSAQLILPEETELWKPIDFKWMGEDPDGSDVGLEFRWELHELRSPVHPDTMIASSGWSSTVLSASFSKIIYDNNRNGKYSFRLWVRDDALEESENHSTVNFEVFSPTLNKGILVIDDTDPAFYPPPGYSMWMGNPEAAKTTQFYRELLEYAGYSEEGDAAADSSCWYSIKRFERITDETGKTYYSPTIRDLVNYRLLIIFSDDRTNYFGVNFLGEPGYAGYMITLRNYLDVGGKVFLAGPSVLLPEYYDMTPSQLPVNKYMAPFRLYFERDIYDNLNSYLGVKPATNKEMRIFFNKYFGIHQMDCAEHKTHFTIPGTITTQLCEDYYLCDNYDFVGAELYEHISDIPTGRLRIDSTKVNKAWFNSPPASGGRIREHQLKDRGTVFTGVPSFETYKGEIIYKYMSEYDLPRTDYDPDISYDFPWENANDTLKHYLKLRDKVTGEIVGPVLRRSGSVATRYIEENGLFRTAFFTVPLYFMDNSQNQTSEMFKSMIKWFEIE